MTISLKWHEYRSSWSLLLIKNSSLPPFSNGLKFVHYDGKNSISQLCCTLGRYVWLQNFYLSHEFNVASLLYMLTLYIWISVHWMLHKLHLYIKTWRYYCPLRWNFWGNGGFYLSVVREGGMMIGLCERWNCQVHIGHQKFFPTILSHRGTCALHEYCAPLKYSPIYTFLDQD